MPQFTEGRAGLASLFGQGIRRGLAGESSNSAANQIGSLMGARKQAEKQKLVQQQQNEQLKKLTGHDFSNLDPEQKKLILQNALQGKSQEEKNQFLREMQGEKFSHENEQQNRKFENEKQLMNEKGPSAAENKADLEKDKENQIRQTAQKSFNGIVGLLKKGNVGMGSGVIGKIFGGETSKDIGKMSALTGGLEAMLVDMVSRGTLSNTRFQYITETLLPKPGDRKQEIKGKLEGLAEILGLDPSSLGIEENKSSQSDQNGKQSLEEIFG